MAYSHTNKKGQQYHLHSKDVTLRGSGKQQRIYYFSKDATGSIDMPAGYEVMEIERTGLPVLKKAK